MIRPLLPFRILWKLTSAPPLHQSLKRGYENAFLSRELNPPLRCLNLNILYLFHVIPTEIDTGRVEACVRKSYSSQDIALTRKRISPARWNVPGIDHAQRFKGLLTPHRRSNRLHFWRSEVSLGSYKKTHTSNS